MLWSLATGQQRQIIANEKLRDLRVCDADPPPHLLPPLYLHPPSPSRPPPYLVFLQMSSFGTGRVRTANCSFKAFFNQELHVLLQALGWEGEWGGGGAREERFGVSSSVLLE